MSGYAQPILDTHGAFAHQIDLLEKPFTEATLLTRVRRAIDNGYHRAEGDGPEFSEPSRAATDSSPSS
jgi:FixJ family two-component response regulator